ncbi:MAG TPA: TIGR01841 family phasin [Lamprocystis sp. (in: g-proteobacteria)]|nr:TIGR01841 family phasin [Lamprocystis sp. (in: g-proteobacteria)]
MTNAANLMSDWADAVTSLDITRGTEALLKIMAGLQVPGVNMDALVASQRDNLEALSASNRAAFEGFKAVGEWQVKLLQETMLELSTAISGLALANSPQSFVNAETELAQKAFETAVKRMREFAEIVTDANHQATDVIVRRIPESLDEIKDALKFTQRPGTP